MADKPPVSRHGLIQCSACLQHVRVVDASCPFCEASLDTARSGGGWARVLDKTRSGVIAASLLGLSAMAPACAEPGEGAGATTGTIDSVASSDASQSGDTADAGTPVRDVAIIPPYGIPPDDFLPPPPEDAALEDAGPDIVALPPYGIPPDDVPQPSD